MRRATLFYQPHWLYSQLAPLFLAAFAFARSSECHTVFQHCMPPRSRFRKLHSGLMSYHRLRSVIHGRERSTVEFSERLGRVEHALVLAGLLADSIDVIRLGVSEIAHK
jgi:hypothetical protein